jgi:ribosomal protein S7|uniref:Ribosomal protein S7 n=1 Tax=Phaeodactylum tricornutum TaxID=2850 RepID=F1DGP0_PHATR|nr:ribosomal protein S7 [Phaeodactylum tricornutum]ADY18518.1 ribosomal protein S7 [Phaeodactylum tricornutum]
MRKRILLIKNKLTNHLTTSGKKTKGEKILFKSVKTIQRQSRKQVNSLIKLAIFSSSPVFKLHILTQKKRKKKKSKEIPAFMQSPQARVSLSIKLIILSIRKRKLNNFSIGLGKEILLNANCKGETIKIKNKLQEQVFAKKHLLKYYRWN